MTIPVRPSLYSHPDLYDAEFAGYRADVPFYRHARQQRPGRWVELGCGTGRLWAALPEGDYVGVDGSAAMLQAFRRRALRRGAGCPWLVHADLRGLPLASASAGLVVMAYNLVQHLLDMPALVRAFREARRVLAKGGALALDAFMPPPPDHARRDEEFGWVETRRGPDGQALQVSERTFVHVARELQHTWLRFSLPDGPVVAELEVTRRLWSAEALRWALGEACLRPVACWGDVDGAPWTPGSPRVLVVAEPR